MLRELGELYPEAADHLSTVREDLSRGFSSVVEELSTALFVAERSGEMDVKDVFFACALLTPSQYRHLRSWQSDRISEERYQALRGEWHEILEQFNAPSRRTWLARIISRNAD